MRVAFLVTSFPSVSETFILDQITGLIDLGCEVEIFAAEPPAQSVPHPEIEAYGLKSLPGSSRWRAWRAVRTAAAFVARPRFDVIHCHFGPNGLRGAALRQIGVLGGAKLITSFYGYDVSEFPRRRANPYTRLFAKADLFLAIGEDMRSKLIRLGCASNRILVHPLGVKPGIFPPPRRAEPGSPLRITTIGRMVPKKSIEDGLRAVAALVGLAGEDRPRVQYVIIGDGPLRPEIERMAADLALGSVVHLAGWKSRPDIVSALAETDILLAPSITAGNGDEEGTPVVIMEALASGVPVVSTLHAGIPEVVRDGVSGFLVPERDVAGLTSALTRLARSPELRARMGAQGRLDIAERHDIGKLNARLIGIYRDATRSGL